MIVCLWAGAGSTRGWVQSAGGEDQHDRVELERRSFDENY